MEKSNHSADNAALMPDAKAAAAPIAKPHASFGERAFNWITYGFWNHGVNLVLSAAITYFVKGKPVHQKSLSRLRNMGISESASNTLIDTTLLSMGGHITALGVKPLEDRKTEIVDGLNAKFSKEDMGAPLADTRKQTWFSVISGRVFTWAAVVLGMAGVGHAVGNNSKGVPRFDVFQEWFGGKFTDSMKALTGGKIGGGSGSAKLGKVLSMELIAVTLGSVLFYASSKLFSQKEPNLIAVKPKSKPLESPLAQETIADEAKTTNFAERLREGATEQAVAISRG